MKPKYLLSFFLAALGMFVSDAHALTINGTEYQKLISANVNGKVGQWYSLRKGYSFDAYSDVARWTQVDVTSTNFEAVDLVPAENAARFSFEYMKETTAPSGKLTATDIRLLSDDGDILLSLRLKNGAISSTPLLGAAGDFTLTGLFEAVGGAWFLQGIVSSELYASINYATGVIANRKDFHASNGSFTLYSRPGETTEVPEPASAALLLTGFAGLAAKRRAKAQ